MKKTSEQWCDYFKLKVGEDIFDRWDGWHQEITLDEFAEHVYHSSKELNRKIHKVFYEQSKRKQNEA